MSKIRQKIADVMSYIYGIGILIALSVGGLSFIGFLVAFIIGGPTAAEICRVIKSEIYPILFYFSSSVVLLGLLKMYVAGEKSMVPGKRQKITDKKEEKPQA